MRAAPEGAYINMTFQEHCYGIGVIVSHLQTLEFFLRVFLCEADGERVEFPESGQRSIALTKLTNYDSLREVVSRYNARLDAAEQKFSVDPQIVKIRDAIAHGRLLSETVVPMTLFKFGKPNNCGIVPIEDEFVLNGEWFAQSRALTRDHLDKVFKCSVARGYPAFVFEAAPAAS